MSEPGISPSSVSSSDYAQFLAQLDDAAFWEYATAMSPSPALQASPQASELLLCKLEEVSCLPPLQHLREILSTHPHYTVLPEHPTWMLGVMAWRGEIVPILDLSAYLMQRSARWRRDDALLITEYDQYIVGWLVSAVETIPAYKSEADIGTPSQEAWYSSLPPTIIAQTYASLPLLDLEKLMFDVVQHIRVVFAHE